MEVKTLVKIAIDGIETDRLEIRPGLSDILKIMSHAGAPAVILES
jgi:hypothetical protein